MLLERSAIPMNPQPDSTISSILRRYTDAWVANDLRAIIDCYHDDIVFHYFGRSPLAGTHRGKSACLAILKQVRERTNRKLLSVRDVLVGEHFGVIVAVECFERNGESVEIERLLRYTVRDEKVDECWVYDEDQRLVDEYLR
jgi:ketosteroid isomerase-like protein